MGRLSIFIERSDSVQKLCGQTKIPIEGGHELSFQWLEDERPESDNDIDEVRSIPDILLIAPDKESPNNILNKLPNECLRAIFEKSTLDIMDLVEIAHVCCRFNAVANQLFQSSHKNFNAFKYHWPLWRLEDLFRTFGPWITSISRELRVVECEMVSKYCPNIKKLTCTIESHSAIAELRSLFSRVDELYLCYENIHLHLNDWLDSETQLKKLSLVRSYLGRDLTLPSRNLQHLVELKIRGGRARMAEPFFEANPQIQVLDLGFLDNMDINVLIDHLPSISKLSIRDTSCLLNNIEYNCNIQHTQFRTLSLDIRKCDKRATSALQTIVQHNVPLENLEIEKWFNIDQLEDKFIDVIGQIKTIKYLELRSICFNDNQMIRLAQDLPNLTKLTTRNGPLQLLLTGIRKFMENAGEQFTHLYIEYPHWFEDSEEDIPMNGTELDRMA